MPIGITDRILISSLTFADSNLAYEVNRSGATYVDELTSFDGSNSSITDLSGIENLTYLISLSLSGNISDLSPLAPLINLPSLYLSGNNITDVSPIATLTNLDSLHLSTNSIMAGVASLITLTNARVTDFTGNSSIPTADLDTLETALGSGIVIRP